MRMRDLPWAVFFVAWTGCGSAPAVPPQGVLETEFDALRNRAQALALPHCGECHDSRRSSSKEEALEVFDLVQPTWEGGLDSAQLDGFYARLGGRVEPADRVVVRRFVAAAKARLRPAP